MSDAIDEFFKQGSQYYAAGRFGVFGWLNPVACNILHHAIEAFLKGGLSKTKSLDELKKIGHKLPKLWDAFKAEVNDASLDLFDKVIANLDSYEEIRYPDKILEKGMGSQLAIGKAGPGEVGGAAAKVPQYTLSLAEIDELTAAIFKAASRNPKVYLSMMGSEAGREYVFKDNASFTR